MKFHHVAVAAGLHCTKTIHIPFTGIKYIFVYSYCLPENFDDLVVSEIITGNLKLDEY